MPLIRNLEGQTALDWTLEMKPVKIEELRNPVSCFDPILAEELLTGMQGYEIFSI
jgi:hypothetical protein